MRYQKQQLLQRQEKGQERGQRGPEAEKELEKLINTLKLIDTTLLKCYIKVGVVVGVACAQSLNTWGHEIVIWRGGFPQL